jgi:hypothetical protein
MAVGKEPYEQRVEPAKSTLDKFAEALTGQLDQQNGAFAWWSGCSDWKTLTMIADYLIQSVSGAADALLSASFSAKTHRETCYAHDSAVTSAWRQLGKAGVSDLHAYLAALPRDNQAKRRELTITSSAEHCFFHLGQTLDRLAAALIIVGGFHAKDVATADWSTIVGTPTRPGLLQDLGAHNDRKRVEANGSPGRTLQSDLLAPCTRPDDFGPAGWLDWTRDTRNAMTHRAPGTKLHAFTGNMNVGFRLARLFYRQGRWSELQSLVFGGQPNQRPFFGAFILRASDDVLDGLCESMAAFVFALTEGMTSCWEARRTQPALIVQHGSQWTTVEPTDAVSPFDGFGEDLSPHLKKADALATHDGARWSAARVVDDRRDDWTK